MIESKGMKVYQVVINVLLVLITLFMLLPIVLLFMSSITEEETLIINGYSLFPKQFSMEAYRFIMRNARDIFRAYGITILCTAIGTVLSLVLVMLTAFPLSIRNLPGRNVIMFIVFFTMLFSGGIVPSYIMWNTIFHVKNTLCAYLFPNMLLSAVNIILVRTYLQTTIPEALYEAARVDGASYLDLLLRIVLPLSKPIIITIALFVGLGYWNDWVNGLYYISNAKYYSIQVYLNNMIMNLQAMLANSGGANALASSKIPATSVRMAIAFIALLPILVIYPFLQKYFAEGIMLGAVKG